MLSKWKVRKVVVAGTEFFEVYRRTDAVKEKDRFQTRGGYWTTENEAQELADRLNNREVIHGINE